MKSHHPIKSFLDYKISAPSVLKPCSLALAVITALSLTACNNDSSDNKSNQTDKNDEKVTNNSPFLKNLSVKNFSIDELQNISGGLLKPKCDVEVQKFSYNTQGSGGEPTTATSALMIPTGGKDCSDNRPILLYAHGTTTKKSYDLSQVGNLNNPAGSHATALATYYAGQGYIVVAPNYAGYDESTLNYHPYLNKKQQSTDMYDALKASKYAMQNNKKISYSNKLFISGYSQGGFVAMATGKHLQEQGEEVTAIAPMSGPYAMSAFADAIFSGQVNQGATIFAPLVSVNYQKQYHNIYNSTSELFTSKYADGIETAIPSELGWNELGSAGKIPAYALFQSNTGIAELDQLPKSHSIFFDDKDYLVKTDYRLRYLADMNKHPDGLFANKGKPTDGMPAKNAENPFRQALKDNDLRGYVPTMPVFLCGGNQDPMVFFDVNTSAMVGIWKQMSQSNNNLDITVLDVDTSNADDRKGMETLQFIGKANDNKRNMDKIGKQVQTQFSADMTEMVKKYGPEGMIISYHGGLTGTACEMATNQYFAQFL